MAKIKTYKQKTHKASSKRFRVTRTGKLIHLGQGAGNGHSNSYKSRRQRRNPKLARTLTSNKELRKLKTLIGNN